MAKAAKTHRSDPGARIRVSTPAHVARLVAELAMLRPPDVICDPAAGGCDLLIAAMEAVRAIFPGLMRDAGEQAHFRGAMFHAFGAESLPQALTNVVDPTNLGAHDALGLDLGDRSAAFTHVLTRVPFAGRREHAHTAKDLLRVVRTTRPELLLLARTLQLLRAGGRAAIIVPEGLLSGATKAHVRIRSLLIETHKVEAVIALPAAVFMPHFAQPTAILLFTRTDQGGTEQVWFYALAADGMSADEARTPLVDARQLAVLPPSPLGPDEQERNDRPDVLARWRALHSAAGARTELEQPRSARSFYVPKAEIAAQGYDLSMQRYKLAEPDPLEARRPHEILAELAGLEAEIFQGMKDLVGMLK